MFFGLLIEFFAYYKFFLYLNPHSFKWSKKRSFFIPLNSFKRSFEKAQKLSRLLAWFFLLQTRFLSV
ncbi:hypothetical protein HPSA20_1050 [Helicobacter pylori SouthAfrica20]|uniref:Uncharacterized protein n=1 Tax=Helicobacter pylori SouthAfrica20 TaxID=1352356 RepID=T1UAF9_HELPX|nr:hypothetical protein HPSA20_1050 [Helicobacter pylori SouthAfrica20]